MEFYTFAANKPAIGSNVFVAPNATLIGDVRVGDDASIWYGCVLRADLASIHIGEKTNVQDLSMLHVDVNEELVLGEGVTIGHSVVLHACTVEDNCLIGMGSTILNGAVIGKGSLVAANSLVPPGKKYPPGSFIMGSPAKVVRPLNEQELEQYNNHYKSYLKAKDAYLKDGNVVKVTL